MSLLFTIHLSAELAHRWPLRVYPVFTLPQQLHWVWMLTRRGDD